MTGSYLAQKQEEKIITEWWKIFICYKHILSTIYVFLLSCNIE